jgi:predicted ATP-grasp superfamily ATP-dependent carboligase
VRAHAIVRAASNTQATAAFDLSEWCRDVPQPGTFFAPGDPVCTVHAAAADAQRAVTLLHRRHALVERLLREAAA